MPNSKTVSSYRRFIASGHGEDVSEGKVTSDRCVGIAADAIHVWLRGPVRRLRYLLRNTHKRIASIPTPPSSSPEVLKSVVDRFEQLADNGMHSLQLEILSDCETGTRAVENNRVLSALRAWIVELNEVAQTLHTLEDLPLEERVFVEFLADRTITPLREDMADILAFLEEVVRGDRSD